ncbi:response regulator, partial [bacterium]|nr:response regulator [bacterium]
ASMSHELRTPMNVIIGFSQLLETDDRDPLSTRQTNHLQKIIRSGEHLLLLINNVLDLAKIESGRLQDIFIEPVDMCSVCHESIELVMSMADTLNIEILPCEFAKSIFISADRTLFRQIFLNLLSNAIKYNKPGGNVAFSCEVLDGRIRLIVADTGIGIAKEKIGLLFEPFNRLGAETSSVEGTGIGLTITKRLIELMHASIDVESEVGKGTKFIIDFPMAEPPANEDKTFLPTSEPQEYDLEKDYILLYVEDDRLNLELMEEILGLKPNLKLLTAEDAESGIDLAIKHKPDIILMDLNLPDLDGFEAFKRLKGFPETKNIPVVAISGDTMSANIQKATLAGFAEYLTKPYNIDILYQVINDILSQKPNKILFPVE